MPLVAAISERTARRGLRVRTKATAVCRRGDRREEAQVLDLSLQGARIRTLSQLSAGQTIWLRLPMLEALQARIVWSRRGEAGCEFAAPLHPAVFDILRQAL